MVHDNQYGADEDDPATTVISGGSIVTHSATGNAASSAALVTSTANGSRETDESVLTAGPAQRLAAFPNPVREEVRATFALAQEADYTVEVYDVAGRLVQRLQASHAQAGQQVRVKWTPSLAATGVYTLRLLTPQGVQHVRLVRQ